MGEKKKTASTDRKALYRKYRSKSLDEIIGQAHVTKTIANALKVGKISHAYLFTGPRGTGKTSIARIIAHAINDLPYTDESTHLDIIEIDAASNRRIDDIRDLRDKVHIAPVAAKYKVYIIDEVHMLTTESFNALLKTLEEPPAHVVFILATTEVHKLPATILSRTQRHSLRLVSKEEVANHLKMIAEKEGIAIDFEALELLAEHGGGSFRDSISLLDQIGSSGKRITREATEQLLGLAPQTALIDLLSAARTGRGSQILQRLGDLLQNGLTPAAIASQLASLLRSDVLNDNYDARDLELLQQLLTTQSAQYPQLKLEATLLSVAPPAAMAVRPPAAQPSTSREVQQSTAKARPLTVEEEPKTEAVAATEVKTEVESPQPAAKINSAGALGSEVITDKWPDILEAIKQKNNSLYTVLRLATAELDDEGLLLIFKFPFHQKKIEESRHKATVAQVVAEVTGSEVAVRSIVDKNRVKEPSTAGSSDPAHASLISQVQDIMGGGEVVRV